MEMMKNGSLSADRFRYYRFTIVLYWGLVLIHLFNMSFTAKIGASLPFLPLSFFFRCSEFSLLEGGIKRDEGGKGRERGRGNDHRRISLGFRVEAMARHPGRTFLEWCQVYSSPCT
ncbi:hypothetical protein BDV26DRAFT_260507 [Aspergillus bertholletiae]|uniref:Uncharacterized protein n=1 Tax=Aspergillus bertholletiae TaxID=1226010 RepID=A0A5N7BAW6_9EURO|nr:hypothetical protein BDV26DRAFT_260507 [Aspergillus bertholletiae]